ncbi:MAG: VCBS repeat-containing protein [bacterium]|nr:VCBS repeat-containing protein [bacterium]
MNNNIGSEGIHKALLKIMAFVVFFSLLTGHESQATFQSGSFAGWQAKSEWNPPNYFILGPGARFAFGDLDGDADKDAIVLSINNRVTGLRNVGSIISPVWQVDDSLATNIAVNYTDGVNSGTALVDLNNDGLLDFLVEGEGGQIIQWNNVGTTASPAWIRYGAIVTGPNYLEPNYNIGVGASDVDGDGDNDLLVMEFYTSGAQLLNSLIGYENTGTSASSTWAMKPEWNLPLVSSTRLSAPTLGDIDEDGDLDMAIGYGGGNAGVRIASYENTGTTNVPIWTLGSFGLSNATLDNASGVAPSFVDLNGNGTLDMIVSFDFTYTGGTQAYENLTVTATTTVHIIDHQKSGVCGYSSKGKPLSQCDQVVEGSVPYTKIIQKDGTIIIR